MNELNKKYTIDTNYHGDVKLTKINKFNKVDLSKPIDTLNYKVKSQSMPTTDSHPLSSLKNKSNQKVCLTKPEDIPMDKNTIKNPDRPIEYHTKMSHNFESNEKSEKYFYIILGFILGFQILSVFELLSVFFILLSILIVVSTILDMLKHQWFKAILKITLYIILMFLIFF